MAGPIDELRTVIDTAGDGVLTNEAGVISGKLDLRTTCAGDGVLALAITYEGAEEWYTLAGANYRLHDPRDHEVVHALLVGVLSRPSAA